MLPCARSFSLVQPRSALCSRPSKANAVHKIFLNSLDVNCDCTAAQLQTNIFSEETFVITFVNEFLNSSELFCTERRKTSSRVFFGTCAVFLQETVIFLYMYGG